VLSGRIATKRDTGTQTKANGTNYSRARNTLQLKNLPRFGLSYVASKSRQRADASPVLKSQGPFTHAIMITRKKSSVEGLPLKNSLPSSIIMSFASWIIAWEFSAYGNLCWLMKRRHDGKSELP